MLKSSHPIRNTQNTAGKTPQLNYSSVKDWSRNGLQLKVSCHMYDYIPECWHLILCKLAILGILILRQWHEHWDRRSVWQVH
jgi:hypothetical protein